jgi:hypothetical protein
MEDWLSTETTKGTEKSYIFRVFRAFRGQEFWYIHYWKSPNGYLISSYRHSSQGITAP